MGKLIDKINKKKIEIDLLLKRSIRQELSGNHIDAQKTNSKIRKLSNDIYLLEEQQNKKMKTI